MGLLDKILGRGKKAAGDVTGDASMRREGAAQEREGRSPGPGRPARGDGAGAAQQAARPTLSARTASQVGRSRSSRLRPTPSLPFVGPMANVLLILLLGAGLAAGWRWLARDLRELRVGLERSARRSATPRSTGTCSA